LFSRVCALTKLLFSRVPQYFNHSDRDLQLEADANYERKFSTVPLNESFPWKTNDHRLGFFVDLQRRRMFTNFLERLADNRKAFFKHPKYLMNGVRFYIHNVDELPFKANQLYYAQYHRKTQFMVTPIITKIDDSLIGFTPEK
jgi:hypothetical protein